MSLVNYQHQIKDYGVGSSRQTSTLKPFWVVEVGFSKFPVRVMERAYALNLAV